MPEISGVSKNKWTAGHPVVLESPPNFEGGSNENFIAVLPKLSWKSMILM